jgi:hypothetical protein
MPKETLSDTELKGSGLALLTIDTAFTSQETRFKKVQQ